MKIAVVTYGIPNETSSQNNADALIHIRHLIKSGYEVRVFVLTNFNTFSSDKRTNITIVILRKNITQKLF